MKIFSLKANENWICDRIANEWYDANPGISCSNMHEADLIWLLAGWCWNHVPIKLLESKKVIVTVHHIVPAKFDDTKYKEFMYRDQFVDAYHIPNQKTAALVAQITDKPIFIVPYWYHEDTWNISSTKEEARNKISLPQSDFVIGSFQRDTEGNSGLPKLEKGPDIFCETVLSLRRQLDKNVHVLLGGWRRSFIEGQLKSANVDYTLMERVSMETLKLMYTACDLYIVSSRFEGGPQALLEASAMKTPIISRDVGMATEVLSPYCIIDLPNQICLPTPETVGYNFQSVQKFKLCNHNNNYKEMFKRVLS